MHFCPTRTTPSIACSLCEKGISEMFSECQQCCCFFSLFRFAKRWLVWCTEPRQPALNENFNLPYGPHVKKHDARLLIRRIAFLTCGKSDRRHLIGLHRFATENLLCVFSVCKSQYVYNEVSYYTILNFTKLLLYRSIICFTITDHILYAILYHT